MVKTVTNNNFSDTLEKNKITLIDFWAPWCGPCRTLSPILDSLSNDNDTVTIGKVNVDEETELAQKYGVRSIPSMLIFKGGEVVETIVGIRNQKQLENVFEKH